MQKIFNSKMRFVFSTKKNFTRLVLLALGVCLLASCSKDDDDNTPQPQPLSADIYIAGLKKVNGVNKPCYFKNEEEHLLSYSGNVSAVANDIFVANGVVYVAGYINADLSVFYAPKKAVVWKNGTLQELPVPASATMADARAVFVEGNDVYVAGCYTLPGGKRTAAVWKNGTLAPITDGANAASPESMYVKGGDVYVAGSENSRPVYWKNGVAVPLGDAAVSGVANDIFVDGSDVYVVGEETAAGSHAVKCWKNAVGATLFSSTGASSVRAVAVQEGVIYVGATKDGQPGIWKNGVSLNWNIDAGPDANAYLEDMAVVKGNILAIGRKYDDVNKVNMLWLWKNGAPLFTTPAGSYTPNRMFVAER